MAKTTENDSRAKWNACIRKLWQKMENELDKKDPHDDWPCKSVVMTSPWHLEVHSM